MQTIFYTLLISLAGIWGSRIDCGQNERFVDLKENVPKTSTSIFVPDFCMKYQNCGPIELFDTTDCAFRIYWQNRNPRYIETRAYKLNQNQQEIAFNTIGIVSRNDSMLRTESYYNIKIGTGFKKNYVSGRLRACGLEIGNGKVGKWKYYSFHEKLDSIVDYNDHWGMTYCEFYKIAQALGMVGENSKMPDRKKFFGIADSLGLRSNNTEINFSNSNWRDYELFPIKEEEKKGHFYCEITFSNDPNLKCWTVGKFFRIDNKLLCFYLSVFPKSKDIKIYECSSKE